MSRLKGCYAQKQAMLGALIALGLPLELLAPWAGDLTLDAPAGGGEGEGEGEGGGGGGVDGDEERGLPLGYDLVPDHGEGELSKVERKARTGLAEACVVFNSTQLSTESSDESDSDCEDDEEDDAAARKRKRRDRRRRRRERRERNMLTGAQFWARFKALWEAGLSIPP
jgi:hypothetical protein